MKERQMAKNRMKQSKNGDGDTKIMTGDTKTMTISTTQNRFDNKTDAPTLEECRQKIREYAYALWAEAGYPEGDGSEFWIEAEKQLFGGMTPQGGYRIYIGDDKNPTPASFILTDAGLEDEAPPSETPTPANTTKKKAAIV